MSSEEQSTTTRVTSDDALLKRGLGTDVAIGVATNLGYDGVKFVGKQIGSALKPKPTTKK